MLTSSGSGGRRQQDVSTLLHDTINNTPEWPQPTALHFASDPAIHTPLHGSLYFLTPGVVAWRHLSCGNLQDAIPILHRVEIDYEPTGAVVDISYVSRYPQWDIVEDIVKRDYSSALVGTKWNQRRSDGASKTRLLSHMVKPALPIGSLLDHQYQVSVMAQHCNTLRTIDTDTMEPTGDLRVDRVCGVEGWTVAAEPLIDGDGKWTCLFAEPPPASDSGERRYKVVAYGPGPDPQPATLAVFKAPCSAAWVDCFTQTSEDLLIVGFSARDHLLFVLVRPRVGVTAVYQSDPVAYVKAVNAFTGPTCDDLFVDCVVSEFARPRDTLSCRDIYPLRCKLTRYTLLSVKVEAARFDGAAGQLHTRFPTATRHHLSDSIVDDCVQCAPVVSKRPCRFAFGRCLSRGHGTAVYYNALCKIDTVERHRKACEFALPNCFPSPVVLIQRASDTAVARPIPEPSHQQQQTQTQPHPSPKTISDQLIKQTRSANPQAYSHEDDLLVVSVIRDVVAERSWVVFVDGQDMVEAGRVELPIAVPLGLSAPIWIPRE